MSEVTFSPLRTDRLILRHLQPGDAQILWRYRSLPEVARYQSWDFFGPNDATRLVENQATAAPNVPGTWFQLAIVDAATTTMIGDCGLHCRQDDPRQMEIGITLDPAYQTRGFATETIECLLDYVFGKLAKHRVSAITDEENPRAAALFRRTGFRQEAHFIEHIWFKGRWCSEFEFGQLRREWEQRRAKGT